MTLDYRIPFNKPAVVGKEFFYIAQAILSGHSSGNGQFTRKCQDMLETLLDTHKVLLTQSYGSALDMAALLCDTRKGDEVIVPSFSFVSVANAFLMRGARPVFVDLEPDTLSPDPGSIESAVCGRTKAIVLPHYAGTSCDWETIANISGNSSIVFVEDASHGFATMHKGKYLGTRGDFGILSFHETNNVMCGEGGAIVINNPAFVSQAEIIRDKGTNRTQFFRGEVDKYTWVSVGSSFLPSDLVAAFLFAQLESYQRIVNIREGVFKYYEDVLQDILSEGFLRLPHISKEDGARSHLFPVLAENQEQRDSLIGHLAKDGIQAVFHYQPLHLSKVGRDLGYREGQFPVTEDLSRRLLRLPFYNELRRSSQDELADSVKRFFGRAAV